MTTRTRSNGQLLKALRSHDNPLPHFPGTQLHTHHVLCCRKTRGEHGGNILMYGLPERMNSTIIARTSAHQQSKDTFQREMAPADHMCRGADPAATKTRPACASCPKTVSAPEDERLRREYGLRAPLARQEGGQAHGVRLLQLARQLAPPRLLRQ